MSSTDDPLHLKNVVAKCVKCGHYYYHILGHNCPESQPEGLSVLVESLKRIEDKLDIIINANDKNLSEYPQYKVCPNCNALISLNRYFGKYVCDFCGYSDNSYDIQRAKEIRG